ncbi:T9SS type B sorting domain-containing protein [Adhaeribacter soli]|uniref:Gliding motility-associated C-terminal domain-containing protein n=1 Tax=Adhaeribacter soli TaxID=2607655 RepID=A0A5N1J6H5_9BACT|nr:gliding motility-associated C-terminal domain-containing protein [Adhaeribacter soli]KAA9340302.1 gliding motility-associated C-terminal domain-containing protein [Adhaeribacter soli]
MITLNLPRILLGFICFIFAGYISFAQQKEGANWIMGNSPYQLRLDFNGKNPALSSVTFLNNQFHGFGVSTISDRNGQLLFFSYQGNVGSRQIVNGAYLQMPHGDLLADLPTRASFADMIVKSPADSNIYYLFFIDGIKNSWPSVSPNLYQVQIDMRLNNGFGDVVPNSRQLLKRNVSAMKLTALMHSNNRDTWVLALTNKCDTAIAYQVNSAGIQAPVLTRITTPLDTQSKLKASLNSEMVAVNGLQGVNPTVVLFDFNRTTGVPTYRYSLASASGLYPLFSFAFSPDNSKLYAGTVGHNGYPYNGTIFQFDLALGNAAQVQQSRNIVFQNDSAAIGDIQIGIDGKLYFTGIGKYLSEISCPNFYGTASKVKYKAIPINSYAGVVSLPTLNQTIFRNADKLQAQAYRNVICEGDSVQLSAYGAGAEQFKWKPANGLIPLSDTLVNPIVNPTETTTYMVIGSSTCRTDTAYVKVTVLPKPKPLSISGPLQVHTYAEKQVYSVKDPVPGNKFDWQISGGTIEKGQGSSRIEVNWGAAGTGSITVTESNAAGCKWGSASLEVEISGEPDLIIYNIITPNNDGKNDAFVIENLKWYPQHELRIFNRWGVEVYQTKNYLNNWKAENISSGIYYYFFTAQGKAWKGWVEVVK